MKKLIVLLISVVFGIVNVNARTCTKSEIDKVTKDAENIKINYEIIETKTKVKSTVDQEYAPAGTEYEVVNDTIRVTIYNITKDMFLQQTNDLNNEKKAINYSDTTNGNYSFDVENKANLINYTFIVYTNMDCDMQRIKTINFVKPMKNPLYEMQACREYQNVPICAKYVTSEPNIEDGALVEYLQKYQKGGHQSPDIITSKKAGRTEESFYEAYKPYILTGIGLVVIGAAAYIVISRKRSEI